GDLLELGDVLGRLAHRDVDVRVAVGRVPRPLTALGALRAAQPGVLELRVLRVGPAVGVALAEAADALDAGGDEGVALTGLDRVRGHANGLQRRRAIPSDRGAGDVGKAGEHADDPAHVEALLATRETA